VIQGHVRDDRDAAVPDVGGIEAPSEAHLDQRDLHVRLREPAKDDRRQEFELGRFTVATGYAVGDGEDLADQSAERVRVDGPPVDDQALAVRDQVRLWRLADPEPGASKRTAGQGNDAALAVRTGDQRAAERVLWVTELAEQCPRPSKAEPDAETSASLEGRDGRLVGRAIGVQWADRSSS